MPDNLIPLLEKFGFPALCLIVVAGFLGWLIKHTITTDAEQKKQLQNIIQNDLVHLNDGHKETSNILSEIRKDNAEAHKYQREEHKEMIESLIKIHSKTD